uniref:Uncharacterized protein n=1 Tax=Dunaliella tertiolecta TaxID=3047 RepID=A0A7S3R471_DUNTE|mmetsp:Transcript_1999/g.5074  ORF Transcript_1999/g.5074 Transcript_1999/m.5074 type:complete len:425 (-) Transcript_1999:677-1951(-)
MEGARDPERRGEALQAWIPLAANFLRSMDSNHLVMLGGEGIFGPASPHETHLNPPLLHGRMPWLLHQGGDAGWGDWSTVLPPMHLSAQFAVCEGADFQRNSILSELDVSAAAVAPDAWLSCSDECKLAWTRQWLAAHMRDALRIQRPLLINAVLSHGPPSRRAALLELVISYMKDAAEQGLPVAGVIMPLHAGISANDCESSFAGYSSQVSPSCYTSSMWQLKEPEDHSALRRLRQSSISSIGPANLQQVFKDADTPPSLPADDVHVLNPACICSPAEHRETESTRVSSLLLMPLPGKNERSTRLAAEAAALRAYWHGFMGGDSLVACLQQAAESLEKKESKAGKTDLENWPAAVDLLELMGEEGTPNVQRQVGIPKASNNPSQSAGESSEIPGPQQRIEMRISGLVGKFLRAGVEAGPVELLP